MIAKITRGQRMRGLVTYLFREGADGRESAQARAAAGGQVEVHTDPHVVASSAGVEVAVGRPLTKVEQSDLATQLDTPKALFESDVRGGYVWQLSLTNHRDDGELSDEEWAGVAREAMAKLGFDDDTKAACPWVAVRHGLSAGGNDHMHVAVSLVREDGAVASWWNDRFKMSELCRELEDRFSLTVVGGRHGETPTQWPGRAEFERAQRDPDAPQPIEGEPRWTPAQEMAIVVRGVAAASVDEAEFVRRLHDAGYEVRPREAPGDHTKVVGYSVRPVHGDDRSWRAGGKLAKDLGLPRLREQWRERGGQPVVDGRAAWRSPKRGPARHRGVDEIPIEQRGDPGEREAQSVDAARWDDAVRWTRETTAAVEAGSVDPGDVAHGAAGVAAALSVRLEGGEPGPIAGLAAQLARHPGAERRSTAPPPPNEPPSDSPNYLVGALAAAAVIAVQGTRIGSRLSVLVLAVELARLGEALAERNRTRQQLAYARALERSTAPVRTAAEASRGGDGPWTVDTTPQAPVPPPPAPTLPAEPQTRPERPAGPSPAEIEALRRRQEQQRRDNERGR